MERNVIPMNEDWKTQYKRRIVFDHWNPANEVPDVSLKLDEDSFVNTEEEVYDAIAGDWVITIHSKSGKKKELAIITADRQISKIPVSERAHAAFNRYYFLKGRSLVDLVTSDGIEYPPFTFPVSENEMLRLPVSFTFIMGIVKPHSGDVMYLNDIPIVAPANFDNVLAYNDDIIVLSADGEIWFYYRGDGRFVKSPDAVDYEINTAIVPGLVIFIGEGNSLIVNYWTLEEYVLLETITSINRNLQFVCSVNETDGLAYYLGQLDNELNTHLTVKLEGYGAVSPDGKSLVILSEKVIRTYSLPQV